MRKLMAVGLMLCILTVLVSGASAASHRSHVVHGSLSSSQYANAYATPIDRSPNTPSSVTAYEYSQLGINQNGMFAEDATQVTVFGGPGSYANTGQTLSAHLYF
jgi:hypothetical protein